MSVLVVNHVSLDGVMQGPGRPDEDTRDGFTHGGWAAARTDPQLGAEMGERMGSDFSWLFGRRTYEGLLSHWNAVGGQYADGLNNAQKYVVSTHGDAELAWPNSTLIAGDAVAALRARTAGKLVVMGSGELVRSLLPHGLVDELLLMVHPVVLGSGRRLFGAADGLRPFRLTGCTSTDSGVAVTAYESLR